jgi:hypothetical protein
MHASLSQTHDFLIWVDIGKVLVIMVILVLLWEVSVEPGGISLALLKIQFDEAVEFSNVLLGHFDTFQCVLDGQSSRLDHAHPQPVIVEEGLDVADVGEDVVGVLDVDFPSLQSISSWELLLQFRVVHVCADWELNDLICNWIIIDYHASYLYFFNS